SPPHDAARSDVLVQLALGLAELLLHLALELLGLALGLLALVAGDVGDPVANSALELLALALDLVLDTALREILVHCHILRSWTFCRGIASPLASRPD